MSEYSCQAKADLKICTGKIVHNIVRQQQGKFNSQEAFENLRNDAQYDADIDRFIFFNEVEQIAAGHEFHREGQEVQHDVEQRLRRLPQPSRQVDCRLDD